MSLGVEVEFWEFVARERSRAVVEQQRNLDWFFEWLEKELRVAEKSKRDLFGKQGYEYWEGYFEALLDVRRVLRGVVLDGLCKG